MLDGILKQARMPPSPWATEMICAPPRGTAGGAESVKSGARRQPLDMDRSRRYLKVDYSQTGYCTNVHAGVDIETTRTNLAKYALAVKHLVSPIRPMGVGLWLSANAAASLLRDKPTLDAASEWFIENVLVPYTFNGFPYGDFHQPVVKHRVYQPTWWDPERLEYTLNLIAIQDAILPKGLDGSISTLPIAWSDPVPTREQLTTAAANLRTIGSSSRLESRNGRYGVASGWPGCFLQRSDDVCAVFPRILERRCRREGATAYHIVDVACRRDVRISTDVFRSYRKEASASEGANSSGLRRI